jgi:carboxymethylenebutenolidase
VELGYTPDDMQAGMALKAAIEALPTPGVVADIQAAVDYAAKTSGGKVGIVGYCWGGLLTWRAAALVQGLSAAAPYYGGGSTTDEEMARHPHCPVLAHYAEQDHWIPLDTVEKFKQAHPDVEVHTYPADHGFNCDHRGAYQEASAKLALTRTLAFFAKHLS